MIYLVFSLPLIAAQHLGSGCTHPSAPSPGLGDICSCPDCSRFPGSKSGPDYCSLNPVIRPGGEHGGPVPCRAVPCQAGAAAAVQHHGRGQRRGQAAPHRAPPPAGSAPWGPVGEGTPSPPPPPQITLLIHPFTAGSRLPRAEGGLRHLRSGTQEPELPEREGRAESKDVFLWLFSLPVRQKVFVSPPC